MMTQWIIFLIVLCADVGALRIMFNCKNMIVCKGSPQGELFVTPISLILTATMRCNSL